MTRPLIIYHSADLDGKCSAAIALRLTEQDDPELYPIDYGQPFDFTRVEHGRPVIMVDFCLEPFTDMIKLHDLVGHEDFLWIDHHKTAIDAYEASGASIKGLREIGRAGCELTWDHLHRVHLDPMPVGVHLLGRYDVWDHAADDRVLPFQYGMREFPNDPDLPIWESLFLNDLKFLTDTLVAGNTILKYERRQNELYIKARGFVTTLPTPEAKGPHTGPFYRVLACNKGLCNSQLFDSMWDPTKHDLMLAFCMTPKGDWKVSLYTVKPEVDVSALAKGFGGGGHRGAAGFQCKELPFLINKVEHRAFYNEQV